MYELIRENQLDIMLILCGACGSLSFLLANTRFLSRNRKVLLLLMELVALFLLWFDRESYIHAGDVSHMGYIMVRISNFAVFFLTSGSVFVFNLYLSDLLKNEGGLSIIPGRLQVAGAMSFMGMVMAIIAAFTNLYYYFDESNVYHRGQGFLLAYIMPILCPVMQYTVIRQYKKSFSRLIYTALQLYILVPIGCGIVQIFVYGISLVNISLAVISLLLYVFMYLDLNNTVKHAHEIEIAHMQGEQDRMRRLFDQTATAFVSAVEMKDDFTEGSAVKMAEYAKRLAEYAGKSSEECDQVYYAALLHDVGLIGIPDEVIQNSAHPSESDRELWQKKPEIGAEILSSITEYPYLSMVARYSHERYDGTGYPSGLKGEEIPEFARIIAVADAYVSMTSRQRYREALPEFKVREALVEGVGEVFDPVYAGFMIEIIDAEGKEKTESFLERLEKEISCTAYRQNISSGIPVERDIIRISFECEMPLNDRMEFASPSIVLFDSYDGRAHDNAKAIESYRYLEYGEVWFDKYSITTAARKMSDRILENAGQDGDWPSDSYYEICAGRLGDHLRLVLRTKDMAKEVIVALPGGTKAAYIGLTGENCRLKRILVEPTGEKVGIGDIPRIVEDVSYIDHLESDIGNVQVDRFRSAYSEGIEVKKKVRLTFHSMSLPEADLVWHCPYVVLYSSDNGRTDGQNYREYVLVKLNGEYEATEEFAENNFRMKRKEEFPGWEEWKKNLKKGMEFEVALEKRGNRVALKTDNLGIAIENISVIREDSPRVYAALTGDVVALTDIRLDLE